MKKPRITAKLPRQPASPAGMAYARTEDPHPAEPGPTAEGQRASSASAESTAQRSTKRQIYVLDVDQIGWIKRLALELFEASDGSDPGQSAIVRAILRGVMDSGIDLGVQARTPDALRELVRSNLVCAK